jgi:hypothetical protein
MAKIRINGKKFARDVRSGLTDTDLMGKYGLTSRQLYIIYEKLLTAGRLEPSDIEDHETSAFQATVELTAVCPHCGSLKFVDSDTCSKCGKGGTM